MLSYFTDLVTFHAGEIGIFSCKRSQRCAYWGRTFKARKEAGGIINITDIHLQYWDIVFESWRVVFNFKCDWMVFIDLLLAKFLHYLFIPLFPLGYMQSRIQV